MTTARQPRFLQLAAAGQFILAAVLLGACVAACGHQTSIIGPSGTPNPTATPIPGHYWDFETDTQKWGTSEGQFKLATVATTTSPVRSGKQSLMVTSQLYGDASQAYIHASIPSNGEKTVYLHTEASVYFSAVDVSGQTASCYVNFPAELVNMPKETYARLWVKDIHYNTLYTQAVNIDPQNSVANHWIHMTLAIPANANDANGVLTSQVIGFGLRVETPHGSALDYTGPFFIDDCVLPYAPIAQAVESTPTSVAASPTQSVTHVSPTQPIVQSSPTHVPPTATPTPAGAPPMQYTFASGTEGWIFDNSGKPESLGSATWNGRAALQVTSELWGDQSPDYMKTHNGAYLSDEPAGYFAYGQPEGAPNPPAQFYNLAGANVACYVWVPSSLANTGAYVRLDVKDKNYGNFFSSALNLKTSNTGMWVRISLRLPTGMAGGFDPTQVRVVAVRIESDAGSTFEFSGSYYVADYTF